SISGYATKFTRVKEVSSKEELYDYLAEIRYALLFKSLDFEVTMEPEGDKGPDLKITKDDIVAFVEVTRFRPTKELQNTYNMSQSPEGEIEVEEYASVDKCIQKIYSKVTGKFNQLKDYYGILALWNDSDEIDFEDILPSIKNIKSITDESVVIPDNLNLIVFASFEYLDRQFHCYKISTKLDEKLETLSSGHYCPVNS
ncbi:hypothetical protein, partial [Trichlorobacter lovleyi]|uniref:hypothetical protein n=1 Tax=Trichlorobacter lovleyi TaxID=313985 RepID=UPI0023F4476C